jgi:hypothetical protein
VALAWKVPSRPVRPCTITFVFLSTRIAMIALFLGPLDRLR